MKQPSKTEIAYRELERLGSGQLDAEAIAKITRAIDTGVSLLASKAAEIAGRHMLHDLERNMTAAFDRFMVDGAKIDKQCNAKIAIATALNRLECFDDTVFLKGAYYVQKEPAFPEFVDTAIELRCQCTFGLARIGRSNAHYVLADKLVDAEFPVQAAAARALGCLVSRESELLLRLKVLTGSGDWDVKGECFAGLLGIAPERSLEFMTQFLRSESPAMIETAALAIGQSRVPGAFEALRECWEGDPMPSTRQCLLLPIALARSDAAFAFLIEIAKHSDTKTACQAVSALNLYADEASIMKIREAVVSRGDPALTATFTREFGRYE